MLFFLLASFVVSTHTPSPQPAPVAPKQIERIRSSPLCDALRRNIFQAVAGLRANDSLVTQGRMMQAKIDYDAAADPESYGPTGGAGSLSQMDDVRLGMLIQAFVKNNERIDALLSDPTIFGSTRAGDDDRALLAARERLKRVLVRQRASLNILSGIDATNEMQDLESRRNPISMTLKPPDATPPRISAPEALAFAQYLTQQSERRVAVTIRPIVAKCQ